MKQFKLKEEIKKFFKEDEHEMNEVMFLAEEGKGSNMLDFSKKDILMRKENRRKKVKFDKLSEKYKMKEKLLKRRHKLDMFTTTSQKVLVRKTHYSL